MTEQQYIDYFERLARLNARIGHTDPDPRFLYLKDDNYADLEEALRSRMKPPLLTCDQYLDAPTFRNDNFRTRIQGGFAVLLKIEKGNLKSILFARTEARRIALGILFRIRKDFMAGGSMAAHRAMLEPDFDGMATPIIGGIATGWAYPVELLLPLTGLVVADDWLPEPTSL